MVHKFSKNLGANPKF